MKLSGDDLTGLVAQYLARSGLTSTLAALREESGCGDGSPGLPPLAEIVDEWRHLKAIVAPPAPASADPLDDIRLDSLLADAREDAVQRVAHSATTRSAALCCAFVGAETLVWGEANKTLHGCRLDGTAEWSYPLPDAATLGGILCLASDGKLIALGTMSGMVQILDADTRQLRQSFSLHKKYVHRALMMGPWLVTASHDCSVGIWKKEGDEFVEFAHKRFKSIPEGLGFGGNDDSLLHVAIRDTNLLCVYDLASTDLTETLVNLSPFQDDHVTFNMLDLAVCPAHKKMIALASDRDRVFIYWIEGDRCRLLSTLTGMNSDGMSVARVQFSPNGRYVYATSSEGSVCVFDTVSAELLSRLRKHEGVVRDFIVHTSEPYAASVSFDKTCHIWEQ